MSRRVIALFLKPIPGKPPPLPPSLMHKEKLHHFSSFSFQRPTANNRFSLVPQNIVCKYRYHNPQYTRYSTEKSQCDKTQAEKGQAEKGQAEKVPSDEESMQKLSLFKRFKAMYRDYWYVLVPVHIVTSIGWFGTFYYLAKSGVDLGSFAESLNLSESIVSKLKEKGHSTTGYLALSYFLYKIATPIRYTVTLGGTTISINYLKNWGYIKPLPKKEELKKMLNDKKESFKEKKETVKQNLQKFRERKS